MNLYFCDSWNLKKKIRRLGGDKRWLQKSGYHLVDKLLNNSSPPFSFQKLWIVKIFIKKMKPKVRPTNSGGGDSGKSGNSHNNSGNSEVKMVRFAATSSLVKEDLTSLLEICNKSMVHQNWPWKKCEPYVPNDEEIYSDLRKRGLKIKNQR